jgi:hypothetical protein
VCAVSQEQFACGAREVRTNACSVCLPGCFMCLLSQGSTLFYSPMRFPAGLLCPVRFLWQPPHVHGSAQLLLWVHPAAAAAFQAQLSAVIQASSASIVLKPVQGTLLRFRVIGDKALRVLQEVLVPASPPSSHTEKSPERIWTSLAQLSSAAPLPARAVLATTMLDPRTRPWRADVPLRPAPLASVVAWCVAWPAEACAAATLWDESALLHASKTRYAPCSCFAVCMCASRCCLLSQAS